MCTTCTIDALELLDHCRRLELENKSLRGAVQRAVCGNVLSKGTSCQLPVNHGNLHAWSSSDGEVLVRWG